MLLFYIIFRIILIAIVCAIKYNEDDYYSNTYYAKVGGITLSEFNKLELTMIDLLDFRLYVALSKYQESYDLYVINMRESDLNDSKYLSDCSEYEENNNKNINRNCVNNNNIIIKYNNNSPNIVSDNFSPNNENLNYSSKSFHSNLDAFANDFDSEMTGYGYNNESNDSMIIINPGNFSNSKNKDNKDLCLKKNNNSSNSLNSSSKKRKHSINGSRNYAKYSNNSFMEIAEENSFIEEDSSYSFSSNNSAKSINFRKGSKYYHDDKSKNNFTSNNSNKNSILSEISKDKRLNNKINFNSLIFKVNEDGNNHNKSTENKDSLDNNNDYDNYENN